MIPRRYVSPVLLLSVVVIATSGLVYELIAGTVASYVLGDSVTQFSFVIGLYLFAMGVGSYLSKFIERQLLRRFVEIELAIALLGGGSAPILFVIYTSAGAFRPTLYGLVMVVGVLVGLEIPLLIRLLKFSLNLKDLVARVLSLDYVGALCASLLFPLLLVPRLGIQRTSLLVGMLNAIVALLATFLTPIPTQPRWRLRAQCAVVLVALGVGLFTIERTLGQAEAVYFGAPILYAKQSPYQRIVLTQSAYTTRLFLNGNLQFSSDDEHRYHEVLVHPGVAALGRAPRTVLILGGGDGLAARELLRYPEVERILLVDLDEAVTEVFRTIPKALELNHRSLLDPRVEIRNEDAFTFLRNATEAFDYIVVDFPDVGKLYTLSFYHRLRERLGMHGVTTVQTTSPYYARKSFWTIANTIQAAGFQVMAMHVHVPSFGEWGFVLAGGPELRTPSRLLLDGTELRYLDETTLAALFQFPRDMDRVAAPINRLNDQQLVSTYVDEWAHWGH
jgi:spermidine synthase